MEEEAIAGVGLSSACASGREQAFRIQCQFRWAVVVDGCVFVCESVVGARISWGRRVPTSREYAAFSRRMVRVLGGPSSDKTTRCAVTRTIPSLSVAAATAEPYFDVADTRGLPRGPWQGVTPSCRPRWPAHRVLPQDARHRLLLHHRRRVCAALFESI